MYWIRLISVILLLTHNKKQIAVWQVGLFHFMQNSKDKGADYSHFKCMHMRTAAVAVGHIAVP